MRHLLWKCATAICALILLLLHTSPLFCSELNYTIDAYENTSPLPELTELNQEINDYSKWGFEYSSIPYGDWDRYTITHKTRFFYNPFNHQLTSKQDLTAFNETTKYCAGYFEKLSKDNDTRHAGQFQVSQFSRQLKAGKYLGVHSIYLGMYNLHIGEGLAFGKELSSPYTYQNQLISWNKTSIGLSSLPYKPHLLGAAARMEYNTWGALVWLSAAPRLAQIADGKITSLAETAYWSDPDYGNVTQNIQGAELTYTHNEAVVGAYVSAQQFSRDFADSTLAPHSTSVGIYGRTVPRNPLYLGFEINSTTRELFASGSLTPNQLGKAIRLKFFQKTVQQSLYYIYRPDTSIPGFARLTQVFGNQPGNEELSWDIVYRPLQKLYLTGRFAFCRDLKDDSDLRWKDRQILSSRWKCDKREVTITYYRFRKSVLPVADSLLTDLLPTQNRYRMKWIQKISPYFNYNLTCQYQQFADAKAASNGYSMINSISTKDLGLFFELALHNWSNQKAPYVPAEPQEDDEYLSTGDRGSALRLDVKMSFLEDTMLAFQMYRPLYKPSTQTFRLSLTYRP